jgi:hypothetical protein
MPADAASSEPLIGIALGLNAHHVNPRRPGNQRAREQSGHEDERISGIKGANHSIFHEIKKDGGGYAMSPHPRLIVCGIQGADGLIRQINAEYFSREPVHDSHP